MYVYLWNYEMHIDVEYKNKFYSGSMGELLILSDDDIEYCKYCDSHDTYE